MQVREQPELTAEEYANQVIAKGRGLFQSRELRDTVAREIAKRDYSIRRSSVRGQQLHPEYVTDYVGTLETGFGNTQYQTFFSVLYTIHVNN